MRTKTIVIPGTRTRFMLLLCSAGSGGGATIGAGVGVTVGDAVGLAVGVGVGVTVVGFKGLVKLAGVVIMICGVPDGAVVVTTYAGISTDDAYLRLDTSSILANTNTINTSAPMTISIG